MPTPVYRPGAPPSSFRGDTPAAPKAPVSDMTKLGILALGGMGLAYALGAFDDEDGTRPLWGEGIPSSGKRFDREEPHEAPEPHDEPSTP